MADTSQIPEPPNVGSSTPPILSKSKTQSRQSLNQLYALPAPLRTFPLPTLIPHNPLSLFHVLYVWLSQTISPPSSKFDPLYQGWWSPDTRSVHVTDSRSIRGLWEQGFYGKGSLSRSEPNWITKERTRRGAKSKVTSEEVTRQRREERQQAKWERARKEREAIDQKLLEEAAEAVTNGDLATMDEDYPIDSDPKPTLSDGGDHSMAKFPKTFPSPVGPVELLSLPNSSLDLEQYLRDELYLVKRSSQPVQWSYPAPVGPLQILAIPNSLDGLSDLVIYPLGPNSHVEMADINRETNGYAIGASNDQSDPLMNAKANGNGNGSVTGLGINGHVTRSSSDIGDDVADGSVHSDDSIQNGSFLPNGSALANGNGIHGTPKIKRQKSVRFSPTVEKNTFIQSEPPSPERAVITTTSVQTEEELVEDKEHFQLMMEEAFFLSYGLGALTILDPTTRSPIPNEGLFDLFRKSSYFPPLANPSLSPDDPFMLNYVVYHHYRSLGWVVRGGAKFSCDFMLYNRGPVFSHAEFAIIILPSYSDKYWSSDVFLQNYVRGKEHRTWAWMHCINRVITQVKKSLVLVYVDIPRPFDEEAEKTLGVDGMLRKYRVREFVMKRWQVNRERGDGKG